MFVAFTKHSVNLTACQAVRNQCPCHRATPNDSTQESALPSVLGGGGVVCVMGAAGGNRGCCALEFGAQTGKSSGKPWLSQHLFSDKKDVRLQVKNYSHGWSWQTVICMCSEMKWSSLQPFFPPVFNAIIHRNCFWQRMGTAVMLVVSTALAVVSCTVHGHRPPSVLTSYILRETPGY